MKISLEEIIAETIFFKENKTFMDSYEQNPDSVQDKDSEIEGKFISSMYALYLPLLKKNVARVKKMISLRNDTL
jgi:hypothetical protein